MPGPTIEDVLTGWEKLAGTMVSKLTFPAPDQTVKTEERTIDHSIKVRIYYPPGYTGGKHVGVYFHGGGWVLGDLNIDDADCRELAKRAGSVLISIDYRLAPQNVFPASVDDCFAGAIWAAKNAASLGGVSDQVFLIGDSAGGQLAICTALKMIDEGYRSSLKGLIPLEPPTIHPKALPTDLEPIYTSYDDYTDRTVDSKPAMIAFYGQNHNQCWTVVSNKHSDAYAGRPDHVYVSPLLHPKIGELPKVFMTANEIDTLRDDARLFKAKLEKQG